MGSWGYGIMQGDILYYLDVYEQDEENEQKRQSVVNQTIETLQTAVIDFIKRDFEEADYPEAFLVLGYMIIENGIKLLDTTKEVILWACENDDDERGWNEPEERVQVISEFKTKVENYKNVAVNLREAGLFETINKDINGN